MKFSSLFASLRPILIVVLVPMLMIGCVVVTAYIDTAREKSSALDATRRWARLAEFPVPKSEIRVHVTDNFFNRWIRVSFEAPIATIDPWLESSEGIANARVTRDGTGIIRYSIPREGGIHAEVIVDRIKKLVRIRASCC